MCNGVHEAVIHRVQTGKVGMPGKMREQERKAGERREFPEVGAQRSLSCLPLEMS